jgi:hypothetical protein
MANDAVKVCVASTVNPMVTDVCTDESVRRRYDDTTGAAPEAAVPSTTNSLLNPGDEGGTLTVTDTVAPVTPGGGCGVTCTLAGRRQLAFERLQGFGAGSGISSSPSPGCGGVVKSSPMSGAPWFGIG